MQAPRHPERLPTSLGLVLSLLITGAALLAAALPAQAAERQARWTVSIEFEREASTRDGANFAKQTLRSFVQVGATLRSDGELQDFNPIDPADTARRLAQAQQTQLQVQQRLQQQAQRPASPGRAAPATQAEMMARVQQMQALCGADRDCLAREAMKFSAAQSGLDAGGQARLQTYGAAAMQCEKKFPEGAARRSCIDNARTQAGGQPDASDHDDGPPPQFLPYLADADCRVEARVRVDERVEGASADVQGMVPFVTVRHAEDQPAAPLFCAGRQMVVDTKTGLVWHLGGLAVEGARGLRTATVGGRTERADEVVSLNYYEAADWIQEQLRRFPRQGEARKVLPVAQGTGQVKVLMRWRFDER